MHRGDAEGAEKMGLGFLKRLFGGGGDGDGPARKKPRKRYKLLPTSVKSAHKPAPPLKPLEVSERPYAFARFAASASLGRQSRFLDRRVGEKPERLTKFALPRFATPEELAAFLKVPLKTLAWLCDYHGHNGGEKIAKKQHYHYQWRAKPNGGWRLIEAPKPLLKLCQARVLREILDKVPPHEAAHAFRAKRSIKTNAAVHAGSYVIVKADLSHFFPSIPYKRVASVFRGLGYNLEVSQWLARLCTNRVPATLGGPEKTKAAWLAYYDTFGVSQWGLGRHVPQGAPTSPALANLCAWALDVRLGGLARKFGAKYTRYADDLTFSAPVDLMRKKRINYFVRYVRAIVRDERFKWHTRKVRVVKRGSRQEVTGLTVNEKPNVPRATFDRLKAILHNCAKHGPGAQNREGHADFRAHLAGKIAFVRSVNPQKAARLERDFARIKW
ncbi:MAG: reverse transcriptase family protein [Planctomycetota bacterium]|nr:reverse transcriptase family protein [Planctomycetota bacterium]